jgi:hypothetical protein
VIDGGTDIAETVRPDSRVTGARWISDALSEVLGAAGPDEEVSSILSDFATRVQQSLTAVGHEADGVSPICSVAVVERKGSRLIVSTVGDVTVYVPSRNSEISDSRFGNNEQNGVAHDHATGASTILGRRRQYLSGQNGMWVVGNNPFVSEGVTQTVVEASEPTDVIIASDGFTRAIHPYRLFSGWQELYEAMSNEGACAILERIRRFEAKSVSDGCHYKKRDDASALVVRI